MGFEHREAIKPGLEWNLESVRTCTKNHLHLLAMCQTLFSEGVKIKVITPCTGEVWPHETSSAGSG